MVDAAHCFVQAVGNICSQIQEQEPQKYIFTLICNYQNLLCLHMCMWFDQGSFNDKSNSNLIHIKVFFNT